MNETYRAALYRKLGSIANMNKPVKDAQGNDGPTANTMIRILLERLDRLYLESPAFARVPFAEWNAYMNDTNTKKMHIQDIVRGSST